MNKEEWRIVHNNENYQVSNYGRVKRITATRRHPFGHMMKPDKNLGGYLCAILCIDGIPKRHLISRLVATAFIENPLNKEQVNHIDSDRCNNFAWNLEWVTRLENMQHMARQGRQSIKPKRVIRSRDGCDDVIYPSIISTEIDGFNYSHVGSCARGKRKTHGGFLWKFATSE